MNRLVQVGSARDVSEQVKLESKLRNESEFNRELTLAAQRSAQEAQRKSLEVLEANIRINALSDVLRAIPVLTKRLLELGSLEEVLRETALTMVNDAQFSSCQVMLNNEAGELEIKHANPPVEYTRVDMQAHPVYAAVLAGRQDMAVDEQCTHIAPIHSGSDVIGEAFQQAVGLDSRVRFFYTNKGGNAAVDVGDGVLLYFHAGPGDPLYQTDQLR
jgi:hypothetical protein